MKPAAFDYVAPTELDDALSLLADDSIESKVIAGGQSLVPSLNMRLARPERLVDISRVATLSHITIGDQGELVIGANVTQSAAAESAMVHAGWPLLAASIHLIGHPQIRHRGTVCGSLAHHDPSSELPAVAMALDARMTVQSVAGTRQIPAADFFMSTFETAMHESELLVSVTFPMLDPGAGWGIDEVARRHGDFAIAGAVAVLTPAPNRRVERSALVLFGVGSRPMRALAAEALLSELSVDEVAGTSLESVADAAVADLEPAADVHAGATERRTIARAAVLRSLHAAQRRVS